MSTERLILETKLVKELNQIIEKLNNEVDMLTKQKVFLQSKLREKKGDKDEKSNVRST
jgi:chaperonin cofactor prefoldin